MDDNFVKICHISEIPGDCGKNFRLDEETEIALFKVDGEIYATDNVCPHNHIPLMFQGNINDMYISCPVHGFEYHLKTGKQPGEAGCSLRIFEVRVEDKSVFVKKPDKKIFNFDF